MVFIANGGCDEHRAEAFMFILFVKLVGDMYIYVEDSEEEGMDGDWVMRHYNDPSLQSWAWTRGSLSYTGLE